MVEVAAAKHQISLPGLPEVDIQGEAFCFSIIKIIYGPVKAGSVFVF